MITYEEFARLGVPLAPLGLGEPDGVEYFCTPRGARIIGRAGVDGIHCCFVQGFGEMVFTVSPMNAGDYVHPAAANFEDFLRLLLACGGFAAIEQAHAWDEERFRAFLMEDAPEGERLAALGELRQKTGLEPMPEPFRYIKELQAGFDYSSIPYSEEFCSRNAEPAATAAAQDWKVTWDGGIWHPRGRAGRELIVGRNFDWDGVRVDVPAAYMCGKGLVLDLCMSVPVERFCAFVEKWDLLHREFDSFTAEERGRIELEHPMISGISASAAVNGKVLREKKSSGTAWMPEGCGGERFSSDWAAERFMERYGLDKSRPCSIRRICFPWTTKRAPRSINRLSLRLTADSIGLAAGRINAVAGGEYKLQNPVTGQEHRLRVLGCEQQKLDPRGFPGDKMEYPACCACVSYELEPDSPGFKLRDSSPGDSLRPRGSSGGGASIASIGIIGGADGPVSIIAASCRERTAFSSLYFDPPENVEWLAEFSVSAHGEVEAQLLS